MPVPIRFFGAKAYIYRGVKEMHVLGWRSFIDECTEMERGMRYKRYVKTDNVRGGLIDQ